MTQHDGKESVRQNDSSKPNYLIGQLNRNILVWPPLPQLELYNLLCKYIEMNLVTR